MTLAGISNSLHFIARLKSLFGIKSNSAASRSNIGMVQGSNSTDKNVNAYESSITKATSENKLA